MKLLNGPYCVLFFFIATLLLVYLQSVRKDLLFNEVVVDSAQSQKIVIYGEAIYGR